jgi:hypothetical protein
MKLMNLLVMAALWAARAASAADFQLIDAEQVKREQQYQATLPREELDEPPMVTRSRFPAIRVLAPAVDTAQLASLLKAPLRLQLAFETSTDARILPQTFRALYGMLKFDITETLRKHAQLSEKGMLAEGAGLPAGAHRIYIQVADDRGRFTEREVRFRVGN